ncbi:DUF3750 domain-containing protein [bacterium]|nr:DUF3750 domain-containing protein [bacterium]
MKPRARAISSTLLAALLLSQGCATTYTQTTERPRERVVQLRCCPLPKYYLGGLLSVLAVHYWFVSWDPREREWRTHHVEGARSMFPEHARSLDLEAKKAFFERTGHWGVVKREVGRTDFDYGAGPFQIEKEWHGEEAWEIVRSLEAPWEYPDCDVYLPWPGPNSNTYAAWVLKSSGARADMHPRAVGKDFLGPFFLDTTTTGTGIQCETPLVGFKVGLLDGVEVHLFSLTLFGVSLTPPAIKTPLGRIGFDDSATPAPQRSVPSELAAGK